MRSWKVNWGKLQGLFDLDNIEIKLSSYFGIETIMPYWKYRNKIFLIFRNPNAIIVPIWKRIGTSISTFLKSKIAQKFKTSPNNIYQEFSITGKIQAIYPPPFYMLSIWHFWKRICKELIDSKKCSN